MTMSGQSVRPPRACHPAGPQAAPTFQVRDVGVSYASRDGRRSILGGVTFHVSQGEVVGIVGRSGTGKTTVLRLLAGLQLADKGDVCLDGRVIDRPSSKVMTVFQDYGQALLPWRTVAKNVAFGIERSAPRREVRAKVDRALELVHLQDNAADYPWQLSGGMQQRVQIARALAMDPEVLLLDEPFAALDAMTRGALQDEFLAVQRETGVTIVFITHDVDEAVYLADRVLVLSGSPACVSDTLVTGLPAERSQLETRESGQFLEARRQLAQLLWESHP